MIAPYRFVQARYYTPGPRTAPITVLVIHTMENSEVPGQALAVAEWFADRRAPMFPAPKASCHYVIDANEIVQCCSEIDVAWHAPGANHNGIGIEHAGRSAQSSADWSDAYSTAMLKLSAWLVADLCLRYHIPALWLDAADLHLGQAGITGHAQVSEAFRRSTHTDPGPAFPVEGYLGMVRDALADIATERIR